MPSVFRFLSFASPIEDVFVAAARAVADWCISPLNLFIVHTYCINDVPFTLLHTHTDLCGFFLKINIVRIVCFIINIMIVVVVAVVVIITIPPKPINAAEHFEVKS